MSKVIYFAVPHSVRTTDRYEEFFYRIAHCFKDDELLEAKELFPTAKMWKDGFTAILDRIDTLVFIRNEQRAIGHGTWTEICQAKKAGKQVLLARMNRGNELVLVPWKQLAYRLNKADRRNYAQIGYGTIMRENHKKQSAKS